ncbi:orotate phosphoribosyltransferase [Leptospira yasudae]|uniref:Orotate phosphoribosyltransferase n=1 Tax=Leptospira yasudae TaxID=2202201 RepID=A0A5F2AQ90_9LEPT|nr:orotate phosphoribosyltransferase [Leptospira yasudae]MBW0435537.1 orotate phosphoribosyltransferase [Leptospira yasudae]RHX77724.1 orotate phosphoribosyltransferase [Leptospira yasudae]RHX93701.1 orotate phosphoribosyltransferase [Leptospira yasudae]TGK25524.1 orotate phosphoribosyltransferase [Leptospira yasudae]TGL78735.1 orotate phosphoribosyltransferase [Leptospira yasudae]
MKQELLELIRSHAYRYSEQPFTLASGKQSRHYFNCKEITLVPDRLELLCKFIVEQHLKDSGILKPEAFGGLTMGADPICYGISLEFRKQKLNVYPLIVRKLSKDHGTKKLVEGAVHAVKTCVIVDDVITTGGSTIQAIRSMRDSGIEVTQGICILDRQEGGMEAILAEGVQMFPIFKKSDFGNLQHD